MEICKPAAFLSTFISLDCEGAELLQKQKPLCLPSVNPIPLNTYMNNDDADVVYFLEIQ